jgi:hypothetical protein
MLTYGMQFANAMRRVLLDDDLVMLIGPASDGALLEIGVLDIEGDDPVVIHAQPLRRSFEMGCVFGTFMDQAGGCGASQRVLVVRARPQVAPSAAYRDLSRRADHFERPS